MFEAKVADILRLNSRDQTFLNRIEEQLYPFIKLLGTEQYHRNNKCIPKVARIWYYFLTTLGNFQTLGEEYTGIIRIDGDKKIPSVKLQIIWLILHVGGEPLLDRFLTASEMKINRSANLTPEAKYVLSKCLTVLKEEKSTLKQIHNGLFYMNGKNYRISDRLTGIKYVLLREWLQDDTYTRSFRLLGNISLFYIVYTTVLKFFKNDSHVNSTENVISTGQSSKGCLLCGDNLVAPAATLCGHIFCWSCVYDSLSYSKTCPICRELVSPSRIIYLQNFV